MNKRKNYSGAFKAKVALEALSGEKTLSALSSQYGVHPNMITQWKRHAVEGLEEIFSGKRQKADSSRESEIKDLYSKIGQLTVERDFLSKAFNR
jgi:transposase